MWLMLMLVTIIYLTPVAGSALAQVGLRALAIDTTAFGLGGEVVFQVLDVYLTIVSMRLIGLYYLHFKKRFAIRME